jgi:hypothetical protein
VARIPVPGDTQDQVILLSRRRCCVCFGLYGDVDVKAGQIAHLDHDNQNNDLENLAFLCLNHHDQYDSRTSQSKGLRQNEIKQFRTELYTNVTAALSCAEEKFLQLFGGDNEGEQLADWFNRLQATALTQTTSVQCLGMRNPLPFDSIYQPTRIIVASDEEYSSAGSSFAWGDRVSRSILRGRAFNEKSITIDEFLQRDQDAVIFSGPGWGKTTFLHHIFRKTVKKDDLLPILITLRRPNAVDDLEKYVRVCSRIQKKQHRACTLLLVDGYDEVSSDQRRRVSEALLQYQARRAGKFYLTCREYYQISQLSAPEVRLEAFTRDDQVRFVRAFLSTFGVIRQDAGVVVTQLEERGFAEFLSHPLLLTLACIVKTSSTSAQPRSGLRLLQRALDVLCFQWDEQKNIDRQSSTPLDGRDRVTILKNIAFTAKSPYVLRHRAEETARKQLALSGMDKVDPQQALMEIARFYGILVPVEDGYEFVHRTIQDFLAAQLWVEAGEFAKEVKHEWNARTGYAACLVRDATEVLKQALAAPDGLPTVTEIIGNSASFDLRAIADALIKYFSANGRVLLYERRAHDEVSSKYAPRIIGSLDSDFVRLANSRFLDFIIEYCCDKHSRVADLLVAYSAIELYERRLKVMHQTYKKALAVYKTEIFTFVVPGAKQAQLQFLNPVPQNRMKDYKASGTEPTE